MHYSHYRILKIDIETVIKENVIALLAKRENSNKTIISIID